mmetsp:Transcript_49831/g.115715  ORF Transcript_49831/g.115715 Transcript_49831/m.115715 type:complete len:205 (-) Transcript_49831:738-1352(-)
MAASTSPVAIWASTRTFSASHVASSLLSFEMSELPEEATSTAVFRSPKLEWQVTRSNSAFAFSTGSSCEAKVPVANSMASSMLFMLTRALNFVATASKASLSDFAELRASSQAMVASRRDSFSLAEAFSKYLVAALSISLASPAARAFASAFLKAASAAEGGSFSACTSGFSASAVNFKSVLRGTSGAGRTSSTALQPMHHMFA